MGFYKKKRYYILFFFILLFFPLIFQKVIYTLRQKRARYLVAQWREIYRPF